MVATIRFDPSLLLRAQGVKVVFFDVDGVLTDGGLFYSADGETLKRFNTLDGHGLKMLQRAGIVPVVITGRESDALRARLAALGVLHAHYGVENKGPVAQHALDSLGFGWHEAAAMGDDWPDLPMMSRCALACAPANAHTEVLALAHFVTQQRGGEGAVRALCDLLVVAGGHYGAQLEEYLQ
jgi:3-deoxy-D-manno-octulosonate 8-phosphate phosphatase (KDO 8-P phosphatase)